MYKWLNCNPSFSRISLLQIPDLGTVCQSLFSIRFFFYRKPLNKKGKMYRSKIWPHLTIVIELLKEIKIPPFFSLCAVSFFLFFVSWLITIFACSYYLKRKILLWIRNLWFQMFPSKYSFIITALIFYTYLCNISSTARRCLTRHIILFLFLCFPENIQVQTLLRLKLNRNLYQARDQAPHFWHKLRNQTI